MSDHPLSPDAPRPAAPRAFTTDEILQAIGAELKAIRKSVAYSALFNLVLALAVLAWIFGFVTIEFRPLL